MGTLGQNIVKARVDNRMKQKDLMEKADLSQRYLSALEHDKVDPRLSVLVRLADALEVSLDYLAGRTNAPRPPETTRQVASGT
jgi:transcriptional regulator with XRE-family HTH domain